MATDSDRIVVAAAGNGNLDLDDEDCDHDGNLDQACIDYIASEDSGAIIVGAGKSTTEHKKKVFSTHGRRVNLQGWGENVFTLGNFSGAVNIELGGDYRQRYTEDYSGTSSATPIVGGAVVALQSYVEMNTLCRMRPRQMRRLLMETGIAQPISDAASNGHIGPFPNMKDAILKLDSLFATDCNNNGEFDVCDVGIPAGGGIPAFSDCNHNLLPDQCDPNNDCNNNGVQDICDIGDETSEDCNANEIPDECELTGNDCNSNGVPDECDIDIVFGSSEDCNGNSLPDECDISGTTSEDCNTNAVPDECDILGGTSPDCNINGIPDECDVLGGTSQDCTGNGMPDECEPDCNLNGSADSCDIAADPSLDQDLNTVPDSCQEILQVPSQYPTIQATIDAADNGDTVQIASGTYTGTGNKNLDFGGKILTVRCQQPRTCTIDCENDGRGFYFHSGEREWSRVEGLDIIGGASPDIHGGLLLIVGSHPTIRNSRFSGGDAAGTGSGGGGGIALFQSDSQIINCVIVDNSAGKAGGGGILVIDGQPIIQNCTIANNDVASIGSGAGINVTGIAHPTVSNSVIWGNVHQGTPLVPDELNPITVSGASAEITLSYCDFELAIEVLNGGSVNFGGGLIHTDPLFVDEISGDYHLISTSPCIDTGDPQFDATGLVDMDGEPRARDGLVDMGADEYNDCNANGIQDYVDIDGGTSADCDGNVVPDECECGSPRPDAPTAEPSGIDKNRYIAFVPQNSGQSTALKVTLVASTLYPTAVGSEWWVAPPDETSEHSADITPIPGWPNFEASRLVCSPVFLDWGSIGLVHVYGPEIFPDATYEIQTIDCSCSVPLSVVTVPDWGDVTGGFDGGVWMAPDGIVDILDVDAVVEKFQDHAGAPIKARSDVDPDLPDRIVNIVDIVQVNNAAQGASYPFGGPTGCGP